MWRWLAQNATQLEAVAALATAIGFFLLAFSVWQTASAIRQANKQAQGATLQEIAQTSRELVLRAMDDPDLRALIDPAGAAQVRDAIKVQTFVAVLIQHFATAHRQWKLGQISPDYWEEIRRDACVFFRAPAVRARWNDL